ncbi:uncharacterized protein LOC129608737 isoform X2 [Condylostylus longicornis]|uniref:uncharacterized protein LOC129608737 isoform X2 n=1 Tax=Condylostylus longicornis TaxID=2530218 RepID=UPI00244DEABC|nr:uncharacterized protein LOC129608737 isoform X2 [Condylostylus longicornis]
MGEEIATDTNEKPDMTSFGKFCRNRGINPNLIMLKITLFVMYGATSSLLPYLTIHMQSIGLTVEEIAIIYLALPFTTFLSPPITGFLVDKFGKYKPVVVMSLVLNAIFHHSLLYIPQQEIPGTMPAAYVIRHPDTGDAELWWSPCPSRECPEEKEMMLIVDQCFDHCLLFEQNPKIEILSPKPSGSVGKRVPKANSLKTATTTTTTTTVLTSTTTELPTTTAKIQELLTTTTITSDTPDVPNTTILPFTVQSETVDYSTLDLLTVTEASTTQSNNITTTEFLENITTTVWPQVLESYKFVLLMHPDLAEPTEHLGIEIEHDDNETVTNLNSRFGIKLLNKFGVNYTALDDEDVRCGGLITETNKTINRQKLTDATAECIIQRCRFVENGPDICPPDYIESDDTIFWIYFVLRFLATIMLSAGVTIMDPIALTMIEKYGGDFGRERLFSSIGMAIFSPITGIMIDYSSTGLGYTDYSAAFYTYDVLLTISIFSVCLMPLGDKLPADNVFRDLWNLLRMPHVIIFILFLFALGNFWGFIESFLFLYLKELGAPNYLLGITITVGTVSSIPFLYGAEKITRIFGHVNLIIIAFFSHAGRLVGYSFIENAWWCFPFEAMEALSCHLMWVAAATYCSILAPKNLLATLIGVLGMAHFSLGRGSGSFTGGLLIGHVGTRDAFRYMGLLAVVGGIAYGLLHLIWLRKFDHQLDDKDDGDYVEDVEDPECEKLTEPMKKDAGTSMSQERLCLMIKYNQIGSLTSLPRGSRVDIHDHVLHRRSSYNIESMKTSKTSTGGSASKVDLLKSALEINHKVSNNSVLGKNEITSNISLGRNRADSAPKLSTNLNSKNVSQPALEAVVLEDEERRESIPEENETSNHKIQNEKNAPTIQESKT